MRARTDRFDHVDEENEVSTTNDPANGFGSGMEREQAGESAEERVAEHARESVDRTAERSREIEDELRRGAAEAADRLRESEERLEATFEEGLERIKAYVRKNPMASAGLAFVAGVVVSSLIRR
jgi:ElaB/YqjD/DUF883 family membrane-anchored ribosome-binding protein